MGKVKVLSDFQSHPAGVLFFSISFWPNIVDYIPYSFGAMSECRMSEWRMSECQTTECRILQCQTTECQTTQCQIWQNAEYGRMPNVRLG
jgi:hypothetical protein